jgi:hypothetical protein
MLDLPPALQILHPSILILTKLKCWSQTHTLTHPKTIQKVASDELDIKYLTYWLTEQNMYIWLDKYLRKSKVELLTMVLIYHNVKSEDKDTELIR